MARLHRSGGLRRNPDRSRPRRTTVFFGARPRRLSERRLSRLPRPYPDRGSSARVARPHRHYAGRLRVGTGGTWSVRGLDDGLFDLDVVDNPDAAVKVATLAVLGAANWTVKWFRPGGDLSAFEVGRRFALQQVRGLIARSSRLVASTLSTAASSPESLEGQLAASS